MAIRNFLISVAAIVLCFVIGLWGGRMLATKKAEAASSAASSAVSSAAASETADSSAVSQAVSSAAA